jgi:flagellar motility protein MotE (MotC chaperone)
MTIFKPRAQTLLTVGLVVKLGAIMLALILAGPLATPGPQPVQAQEAKAADPEKKDDKAAGEEKEKGEMAGAASAVSKRQKQAKETEKSAQDYQEAKPTATKAPEYDPTLMKLIEQKRAELGQEEARIEVERKELEKLRGEVNQRIAELKKVQDALNELVTTEKKQRRERNQRLVKVLSNMRGPAAAAVVEKLDDQMAVEIFSLMQARQAGKVMSNLKPDRRRASASCWPCARLRKKPPRWPDRPRLPEPSLHPSPSPSQGGASPRAGKLERQRHAPGSEALKPMRGKDWLRTC